MHSTIGVLTGAIATDRASGNGSLESEQRLPTFSKENCRGRGRNQGRRGTGKYDRKRTGGMFLSNLPGEPSLTSINKEWTKSAQEMVPTEFKDPRSSADVGRKLESAKAALKKQEGKQGASVEEITAELTRAKKAYDTAVNEVKTMVALNKVRVFSRQGQHPVGDDDKSARADRL